MKNFLIIIKPFAIPIVFGVFILGGLINQCSVHKADEVNNTTEIDALREYLIDSVQTSEIQISIAEMQAEKQKMAKETAQYKNNAYWYKDAALRQKHISDSLLALIPKADTVCLKTIASKQAEIDTLNLVCDNLDNESIGYSKQLFLCENQSELKDGLIESKSLVITKLNNDILILQKSNKRNWIERNKMWIGFVGGIVGTGLIMK